VEPIIGETTLTGQKVIELAGEAANGAVAHVGLTADAPLPAIRAFRAKFEKEYKYVSDHNGMKGYSGIYFLQAAIEKAGRLDRKAVAAAMKGLRVNTDRYPGALMYTEFDRSGDLDRISFLVEVKNGKQEVVEMLPPLNSVTATLKLGATAVKSMVPAPKPAVKKP
jgi:branched-chain amino acid transport system substrate-binding protein